MEINCLIFPNRLFLHLFILILDSRIFEIKLLVIFYQLENVSLKIDSIRSSITN